MDYPQHKQSEILIIGETCIDRYLYGICDRISPEAPVPILKFQNQIDKPGMAANVFNNIISLGQKATIVGGSGNIVKTRFIDTKSKQQILRMDTNDTCDPINVNDLNRINFDDFDATIISDYNKGFLPNNSLSEIISILPKPIFVDSKKANLGYFENCFIKINESEHTSAFNIIDDNKVIVTLGDRGARYNGRVYPTSSCEVIDVCGAGDTFIAALVVHYLQYFSIELAIMFANKCAGISVRKSGVYNVGLEEVKEYSEKK